MKFALPKLFKQKKIKILLLILILILILILVAVASVLISHKLHQAKNIQPVVINNPASRSSKPQTKPIIDWSLSIAKLDIDAPIILNVDGADKDAYFKALQGGVAQMKDTALPGEGNTVIFGHSNFYEDDPGKFKTVFAHLDQLAIGDEIQIVSREQTLTYAVSVTKMVEATDVSVAQPTENKQLTLITCWPPGTIDQRLVVVANLQ